MIIQSLLEIAHKIVSPIKYRHSAFETAMTYARHDGKCVEVTVTHLPNNYENYFQGPTLSLATRQIKKNPNCTPNALIGMSMKEARLLRDFLNRPEVADWLDEEEEEDGDEGA